TWVRSGEAVNPNPKKIVFQEPGLIKLSDGRILMYIRADAGCQYVSYSSDGGKTWTKAKKSPFVSRLAPMTLQHIPGSNNILAVWTEDKAERNPLVIAVVNEKLEFISKQILDKSGKDPALWYCYSAILPLDDNRYLISYCAGLRKNWGLDTTKIVIVDMSE
ncbi:MAG: exo-alpha-sialidase, partial [Thermoguttaceae bacterium]|nr:exo-alpha-sialidase [Thermoguttaceae bacterium]